MSVKSDGVEMEKLLDIIGKSSNKILKSIDAKKEVNSDLILNHNKFVDAFILLQMKMVNRMYMPTEAIELHNKEIIETTKPK